MDQPRRVMEVAMEDGTRPGTRFFHINDGWHYHMNRSDHNTHYFKCVSYERGCQGRAIYDPVDGFIHTQDHNHPADLIYPQEMALRNAILNRCRQLEYVPYRRIMDEEYLRFPEAVARVTFNRMRTPMRNARMSRFPPPPQNLRELTQLLHDPHNRVITMTDDGNDNIYAASVDDAEGGHHVCFASRRQLELMTQFRVLHSDGTFRTVPVSRNFAYQIFCIVGVWNDNIILLGVVLMETCSEVAYAAVLSLLRHLCGHEMDLVRVITDFETGQQNAWETIFQVVIQGCLWHMCRAFLDHIAEINLIRPMRRIPEVRAIILMCMALPLLPNEAGDSYIVRGFRIIVRHARDEGNYVFRIVQPFLQFVWRNWVGRAWRRRRMCVFGSFQRTNNVCESMNHSLRQILGVHPNIYEFIRGIIILEQRAYNTTLALDAARRPNRARKMQSVLNDERIQNLTRELLNPPGAVDRTIFRFLRAASHLLDNMVDEALLARRERHPNP